MDQGLHHLKVLRGGASRSQGSTMATDCLAQVCEVLQRFRAEFRHDLANLARGPEPSPGAVGFDHEHLDLHAVHRAQRLDLVANEHTELRSRGRGVHARHDQHPHRARSVLVNAVFHDAVAQSLHARLEP